MLALANYSKYMVGEEIPLCLSKREVCFDNHKNVLVLGMKLVICWSTSYDQKNSFLVLEREISNLGDTLRYILNTLINLCFLLCL